MITMWNRRGQNGLPRLRVIVTGLLTGLLGLAACSPIAYSGAAKHPPKIYVGNFKDNTVSVIDADAGTVVATVPVSAGPHGMAITQDGRTVYVSGDGSSSVDVIDTVTDKVVNEITVGKAPNGIALTPDGNLLAVTVYGEDRVAFIDTATQRVIATTAVPKPHTVAISPDGKLGYVTVQKPGHFGLAVIDMAKHSIVRILPLDKTPRDGEFGYNGKFFYFTQAGVSSVQVLDPASGKIVAQIPTGVSPHFVGYPRGASSRHRRRAGTKRVALVRPDNEQAGAQCSGRQTASLGHHITRRQNRLCD
jgi:YVTN family beta-propeller protein